MDIIVIFNGLGNQMSQYAFYLAKCRKTKECYIIFDPESKKRHNGSELELIFDIKYPQNIKIWVLERILILSKIKIFKLLFYLLGIRFILEPRNYDFTPYLLSKGSGLVNFYIGGWHSERYFSDIKCNVVESFVFKKTGANKIDEFEFIKKSILNSQNSVSLHVRRGDFLNISSKDFYQFGGVSTIEYYKTAINYFRQKFLDVDFFVFSNDIDWCKKEFGSVGFSYIECNSGSDSWRDMYLMTLCKHHINANSTFSWWGAWLTENENTITVCPNQFIKNVLTKDIYPKRWMHIKETGEIINN